MENWWGCDRKKKWLDAGLSKTIILISYFTFQWNKWLSRYKHAYFYFFTDLGTTAYAKLSELLTKKSLLKDICQMSGEFTTSSLESFHSVLNHFAPQTFGILLLWNDKQVKQVNFSSKVTYLYYMEPRKFTLKWTACSILFPKLHTVDPRISNSAHSIYSIWYCIVQRK